MKKEEGEMRGDVRRTGWCVLGPRPATGDGVPSFFQHLPFNRNRLSPIYLKTFFPLGVGYGKNPDTKISFVALLCTGSLEKTGHCPSLILLSLPTTTT